MAILNHLVIKKQFVNSKWLFTTKVVLLSPPVCATFQKTFLCSQCVQNFLLLQKCETLTQWFLTTAPGTKSAHWGCQGAASLKTLTKIMIWWCVTSSLLRNGLASSTFNNEGRHHHCHLDPLYYPNAVMMFLLWELMTPPLRVSQVLPQKSNLAVS